MAKAWMAAALASALLWAAAPAPVLAARAKVGKPAPDATVTRFDKSQIRLSQLRGKVVVINHWATWCGPCKAEMPMMSAFHRRHKDKGFEIFGVTTEDSVPPRQLQGVAAVLSYPLALKIGGGGYPILGGVPTTYVIDRKGIVRFAASGALEAADFHRLILPLLAEPSE